LCADEYIISYRSVVKDATLTHESLNISRAMQKCDGYPSRSILLDTKDSDHLKTIILENFDEFFELIQQEDLHVRHQGFTAGSMNRAKTVVTLPARCFTVDFNQGLVKISTLK
jgi:hypothetical protein